MNTILMEKQTINVYNLVAFAAVLAVEKARNIRFGKPPHAHTALSLVQSKAVQEIKRSVLQSTARIQWSWIVIGTILFNLAHRMYY